MSVPAEYRPLVWITDDSEIEATFTERALGPSYDYEHFRDGSMVIERLAAGGRQPDVLLLDWVMPMMSGDEVCRFLRSQPHTRELPIILVTASRIETRDIVEGLTIGANDYVARPFVPEELRARVDNTIRAKRLRELASRERTRLAAIGKLGRAFIDLGPRSEAIVEALASCLVEGVADGCAVTITPGALPGMMFARHRSRRDEHLLASFTAMAPCVHEFVSASDAKAKLPPAYHPIITKLGMSSLAVVPFPTGSPVSGFVTAMRDGGSPHFVAEDLVTLQTCLEYAAIAFENALRSDAERGTRMQLQTILENLPISIVVADTAGQITHVNQTALEYLPVMKTSHSLREVQNAVKLRTPEGVLLEDSQTPLAQALAGAETRGVELTLDVTDMPSKIVRVSAVPLRDVRGTLTSAILAFDDITAEREAILERERAAEFQRYVLGIVSHDLRSPLQTLVMGCEGIKLQAADNPKVLQTVDRMMTASKRMRGIIEQLLDVVRTQLGGGIPLVPSEVNLGQLVTSVLGELALAHPDARFEAKLDNVRGTWDADRLAQVVTNLVNNAIQHGAPSQPVWIETERAGEEAVLRVRNVSAKSLTEEQKVTIFTPFRRTKRASGGSGLGLGLYIASEILRAHQGRITVTSDPETTTFIVRLPLVPQITA